MIGALRASTKLQHRRAPRHYRTVITLCIGLVDFANGSEAAEPEPLPLSQANQYRTSISDLMIAPLSRVFADFGKRPKQRIGRYGTTSF